MTEEMAKQLTEEIAKELEKVDYDVNKFSAKHIIYITILRKLEDGFEYPGV